jgi:hypothetical protein
VSWHFPVPLHEPLQPAKDEPAAAVGVKDTTLDDPNVPEQTPGHKMPAPLTLPAPLPMSKTISVWHVSAGSA